MDDRLRRRWRSVAIGGVRQWWGRLSRVPSASSQAGVDRGADPDADLIADILEMTRHAARDGLPLSAVLEDLRLVLDLGPADVLPVDALRACALEWARSTRGLARTLSSSPISLDDLEGLLWATLGSSPEWLPARAVVVRPRAGRDDDAASTAPNPRRLLDGADRLVAAAQVMTVVFDHPGEHVVLLRTPPARTSDRAVVLLPRPAVADSEDSDRGDDRVALLEASLASATLTGATPWSVEVHLLADHPRGLLAGLREALGPA
jgi:hypothetical protein